MDSTIRTRRKALKLTIGAAARQLQTDTGHLSRIERGHAAASIQLARRMAALYEISVDDVVGGPDLDGLAQAGQE